MYVVRIYFNNASRPPETSDPVFFGSFKHARRFAESVFRANLGTMTSCEIDPKKRHHMHGSTHFGTAEVVVSWCG